MKQNISRLHGTTTPSITTLSITGFGLMTLTLSIMTLSLTILSKWTYILMTLSMKGIFASLSISHTEYKRHYITILNVECHYAECRVLFIDMLNVVMLGVLLPSASLLRLL